jgi:hypothetical protein
MTLTKILIIATKAVAVFLVFLLFARFTFPKPIEDKLISPTRRMPVFGKVLGTTWETTGSIKDYVTNEALNLADQVETDSLGLDEAIQQITDSENPGQEVKNIMEQSVSQKVEDLKNLPKEKYDAIKQQVRNEMYGQVCEGWLKESTASGN